MPFPMLSGEVARLLGTTEPKLAETVRRGRVSPAPPVVSGRRLWSEDHLRQAAVAFGREADLFGDDVQEPAGKGVDRA